MERMIEAFGKRNFRNKMAPSAKRETPLFSYNESGGVPP